jgi:purine nucleosidase
MAAYVRRPVIIDTDPGTDDAIAILFALGSAEQLDVRALTAVAGNVSLELAQRNARVVRDWADRTDLPVYAGCARPLKGDLLTAEDVHGVSGMDGISIPEPKAGLAEGHAVDFLIGSLRSCPPASLTLCGLGPLTNLATALERAHDIKRGIAEIVLMGGAYFNGGNVTPSAEFNTFVDPHAADLVFRSGLPLTILPLDVTHKALATPERIACLEKTGNHAGALVAQILTSLNSDQMHLGLPGIPLHDPCVIAYLLDPSHFIGRYVNVVVETRGEYTLGATVVDWHGNTGRAPNARWITEINCELFFAHLAQALSRLP